MASQLNAMVAKDLESGRWKWILHINLMYFRYTVSVFIQGKRTTRVIENNVSLDRDIWRNRCNYDR